VITAVGRGRRSAGRATPRCDGGSATAELAASLPAVVLLLLVGLTAVDAVGTQTRCVDAARDVALALARGEPQPSDHLPPGGRVAVDAGDGRIAVTVTAPVFNGWRGGLTVSAHAVAAPESP
jgi:TadE-like protein